MIHNGWLYNSDMGHICCLINRSMALHYHVLGAPLYSSSNLVIGDGVFNHLSFMVVMSGRVFSAGAIICIYRSSDDLVFVCGYDARSNSGKYACFVVRADRSIHTGVDDCGWVAGLAYADLGQSRAVVATTKTGSD